MKRQCWITLGTYMISIAIVVVSIQSTLASQNFIWLTFLLLEIPMLIVYPRLLDKHWEE